MYQYLEIAPHSATPITRMDSQELVTLLHEINLWPEEESARAEIAQLQQTHADAHTLARELLQRNVITPYQANQLLTGKARSLVFGPYRVLDRVAEGGMGLVYRARHYRIHRIVALKVIRKTRVSNARSVDRFLREVRASARLSHPNVVRAYDADQVGDDYYFAMEFLDGEDLSRRVKKTGPLPLDHACNYLLQAARGLQHLHENDLIHRDIKPGNLMVIRKTEPNSAQPFGHLKLLDLGLAYLVEDPNAPPEVNLTQLGAVLGTTDYMSPEQAIHSRKVDIRSDIYSLGCTFYYALAGVVPFPGGGPVEKILKHQLDTPIPLEQHRPDMPRPLLFVIAKMMARKREERFQTPQELVAALQTALDSRPAVAVPVMDGSPFLK
jgi:serine/threonine protein kinase